MKPLITSITPVLQTFIVEFFSDIISFQHVLHFDVGKSQIEWIESESEKLNFRLYSYNAKRP